MGPVSQPLSGVVAVCAAESSFVQATASPALIVTVPGSNAKSRMVTVAAGVAPAGAVSQAAPDDGAAEPPDDGAAEPPDAGDGVELPPQATTTKVAATSSPGMRRLLTVILPDMAESDGRRALGRCRTGRVHDTTGGACRIAAIVRS